MFRLNFAPVVLHRVVEVRWLPRTTEEWAAYTAARMEAPRVLLAQVIP